MEGTWAQRRLAAPADGVACGAIFALGALLFWLSEDHPSLMPVWGPWDFSWPEYLTTALVLLWFARGLAATPPEERPRPWRRIAFLLGIAAIYGVLQTRYDYMAQHMFFLNRIQHVVMHHLGPFLIALGCAGGTIRRGMPRWAQSICDSRPVAVLLRILQQPVLAAFLFVGLFYFWLIPPVHFRAMLDARLYALMNWSMVLDGILFWALVLDPRPKPPARASFGTRAALSMAVMFPQILLGAIISFSSRDLYPFYDLCGRLFPSISALDDQHIGGIVSWIPPAMMSVVGVVLVLNALRVHEDSITETDHDAASLAALSRSWTGR
ncbi:MAG TPA: cytochrome c oxidase assembly protein [Stellaceae bacterium]|nr:cytochrome c oxidase assembly protein [Stellaceae bacterium]